MKEQSGRIINYAAENRPVPGCTISRQICHEQDMDISVFSMAAGTDISAECYEYHKLLIVCDGEIEVYTPSGSKSVTLSEKSITLTEGNSIWTPVDVPVGIHAKKDSVYMEIAAGKESRMNEIIKSGKVFKLGELVPYQEGRIVNMDLLNDPKMKFVIMSFDAGTGLSEHAAPREALVFALDGEGIIGYEGKDHVLKAGECFKFDKLGKHSVTAEQRFKMALLLMLQ